MPEVPAVGTEFAGYRIEKLLGHGGGGLVYLARDERLSRPVALKLLASELAGDERFRERFTRELRLAASIDHHNIVPIYEAGEVDGVLFIAMRYVAGTDLGKLLAQHHPLDAGRTLSIIAQVAAALDVAHGQGLVHRDVKPGNILVVPAAEPDGADHAYLTDFGISKRVATDVAFTMTGQFVGTADYVAPEQIMGKGVDGRADIYSLGCVLYECLSGERPFERDSDVAVMYAHLSDPRPRLSDRRPGLPAAIDDVIARALAASPADRYPTATALAAAARRALLSDAGSVSDAAASADAGSSTAVPAAAEGLTRAATLLPGSLPAPAVDPPPAPGPGPAPAGATMPAASLSPPPATERLPVPAPAGATMSAASPPAPGSPSVSAGATMSAASLPPPAPPGPRAAGPAVHPAAPRRHLAVPVVLLVVVAAVVGAVLLMHRSSSPSPAPATGPGAAGTLLTAADFPPGSVTSAPTTLRVADIRCGAVPVGEVGEQSVSYRGAGASTGLAYFDASLRFGSAADANAYLDRVATAIGTCGPLAGSQQAAPSLGDRALRVVFSSGGGEFTYDAVYARRGAVVAVVLVSRAGTAPPAPDRAVTVATAAVGHLSAGG